MAKITRVTITEFSFDVPDIGLQAAAAGVGNMAYVKSSVFRPRRFAVKIDTDEGASGGYVANWIGTPSAMAQAGMLQTVIAALVFQLHLIKLLQFAEYQFPRPIPILLLYLKIDQRPHAQCR